MCSVVINFCCIRTGSETSVLSDSEVVFTGSDLQRTAANITSLFHMYIHILMHYYSTHHILVVYALHRVLRMKIS